ncbi:hypothetical protein B0H13DRAFT_51490 [Mycena leptocephala]|nr:hypothetical protein B0H13DRAFT_51490 [Mycena leptocephala]
MCTPTSRSGATTASSTRAGRWTLRTAGSIVSRRLGAQTPRSRRGRRGREGKNENGGKNGEGKKPRAHYRIPLPDFDLGRVTLQEQQRNAPGRGWKCQRAADVHGFWSSSETWGWKWAADACTRRGVTAFSFLICMLDSSFPPLSPEAYAGRTLRPYESRVRACAWRGERISSMGARAAAGEWPRGQAPDSDGGGGRGARLRLRAPPSRVSPPTAATTTPRPRPPMHGTGTATDAR